MMNGKKNELFKNEVTTGNFEMPECELCYDRCGICIYYSTENWHGFCDYHRRRVSSSDSACSAYN